MVGRLVQHQILFGDALYGGADHSKGTLDPPLVFQVDLNWELEKVKFRWGTFSHIINVSVEIEVIRPVFVSIFNITIYFDVCNGFQLPMIPKPIKNTHIWSFASFLLLVHESFIKLMSYLVKILNCKHLLLLFN